MEGPERNRFRLMIRIRGPAGGGLFGPNSGATPTSSGAVPKNRSPTTIQTRAVARVWYIVAELMLGIWRDAGLGLSAEALETRE